MSQNDRLIIVASKLEEPAWLLFFSFLILFFLLNVSILAEWSAN